MFTALSGKFEEMQYNELNDFDPALDVNELEAAARSRARLAPTLPAALSVLPLYLYYLCI